MQASLGPTIFMLPMNVNMLWNEKKTKKCMWRVEYKKEVQFNAGRRNTVELELCVTVRNEK